MVQLLIEQRRHTVRFFALSMALAAVTAWAVYNELETRRPWKKHQREFIALERASLEQALAAAEKKLAENPAKDKLAKFEADMADARARLKGAEYREAAGDLGRNTARYDELQQALSFLRSERDEAFYQWKQTVHQDREDRAFQDRFARLDSEVKVREKELDELAAARDEAQARVDAFSAKVTAIVSERGKITAERDRILSLLAALEDKKPRIAQVLLPKAGSVDRCMTCHPAIDRQGFDGRQWKEPYRTHPDRDVILGRNHPAGKFGCTVCHRGQGAQLKGIGAKPFDHGRSDPYWETPMFKKPLTESSCEPCHDREWDLPGAPVLSQGKRLFADLACAACHLTPGFENQRRIGPSLASLRAKIQPAWLIAWLEAPRNLRPRTRMPHTWITGNNTAAIAAVAAFLLSVPEEKSLTPLPGGTAAPNPARGHKLFIERGCAGCHLLAAISRPEPVPPDLLADFGPDLDHIAAKLQPGWIRSFLADPAAWYPETRMPNSLLSAPDQADLAAFLEAETGDPFPAPPDLTAPDLAEEGRRLLGLYGCFACHQVPGFEQALRIAPELTGFGDKAASLLSFGDTVVNHRDQTWERWTRVKLTAPRAFATERENLVMPDNGLDPEEADALTVYLKALRPAPDAFPLRALSADQVLAESGQRLLAEYNCLGCHIEDGRAGTVRALIADPGLYPPDLTGEGAKVQPEWLFQFLKNPTVLRPWLTMQMPRFGLSDQAAQALVHYFMDRSDMRDLLLAVPADVAPDLYAETDQVFVKLQCLSCHQLTLGPAQKLSDLAPDMGLTRYRLRPQWMLDFIIDPQRLMPGTKMPTFFPLEDDEDPDSIMTPFPEWRGGDARAQIRAVRDYLYVMQ